MRCSSNQLTELERGAFPPRYFDTSVVMQRSVQCCITALDMMPTLRLWLSQQQQRNVLLTASMRWTSLNHYRAMSRVSDCQKRQAYQHPNTVVLAASIIMSSHWLARQPNKVKQDICCKKNNAQLYAVLSQAVHSYRTYVMCWPSQAD